MKYANLDFPLNLIVLLRLKKAINFIPTTNIVHCLQRGFRNIQIENRLIDIKILMNERQTEKAM